MTSTRATLVGGLAILLWSLLALLTVGTGRIPPFQLAAMTFALGGVLGLVTWLWRPGARSALRQPLAVWFLGVSGLFGYHALYFMALRLAPAAEAGLIAYLWPLLIVLFSGLLAGGALRLHHVLGALLGFGGTALLFAGNGFAFAQEFVPGYAAAFVAAFVWATYSVMSRSHARVPTDAVTGFCLTTAALAFGAHLALEETSWPTGMWQWAAVVGLGVGPVGAAFYAWDFGVKHGDVRILGAASYAAPVLSTGLLIAAGMAEPTPTLAAAAVLIAGGGLLAAREMLSGKSA